MNALNYKMEMAMEALGRSRTLSRGQVNRVSVEEVEAQPDAVIGKFLVKSFTALVLFDTGASHSYISREFVDKYKLPTKVLRTHMLVSSLGAEYMASHGCFQVPLSIGRHVFPSDLIILESQGWDVILGMAIDVWRKHRLRQ